MKIIGTVSEYNPFHEGHLYQMRQSRGMVGEDALFVCVMSGDYVQRGEPAWFSKFARAEAACRCGADLVIELPLPWCLSSAETYAEGAVRLLNSMGCTHLSFGSECGEIAPLQETAALLAEEGSTEQILQRMKQDETLSFARVRQQLARERLGDAAELLSAPNNILGVEYLKALQRIGSKMEPITVQRIGSGHDAEGGEGPASASQLRRMLSNGESPRRFIPEDAWAVFERELQAGRHYNESIMEAALLSRLRMLKEEDFELLPDAQTGAGRRLFKAVRNGTGAEEIVFEASGKKLTAARMRRMLLCAALGIRADDTKNAPPYARLLAISPTGRRFLKERGEAGEIPLVTKPASVRTLGGETVRIFGISADAHDLFALQFVTNDDRKPGEDWRKGPFLVQDR